MPSPSKHSSARSFAVAILALLLSIPATLRAADAQPTKEAPQLSETVSDGLAKLRPLIDAKDWDGAIKLIDILYPNAAPESYDQAFLLETKAKLLAQKGDYIGSIEPLETSLAIADRHDFYETKQEMSTLYFLSQLYYQEAEAYKNQHDAQIAAYGKAVAYVERWIKIAPKPTEDVMEYYSRLLYAEAVAKDPAHPDPELITQAREQLEKCLLMTSHPKDTIYAFLIAILQLEQNYVRGAEIFELLLSKNPANKVYWQDLVNYYIVLAQGEKDPDMVRKYDIRAIISLERAQAHGYMRTPKDNYLLFVFYYECGQYGAAADLLYKGLMDGSIDSEIDKWELLANAYQQINRDFTAIEVLQEAAKRFPKDGDFDLKIGGIYAQLDNGQKAYEYYKLAAQTGGLPKSQEAYLDLALAYQAYELGDLDQAKDAIDKAIAVKGTASRQLLALKKAIEDAIKERDEKKAEASAPKQL